MRFKRYISTFVMAIIVAVAIPLFADTASAQKSCYRNGSRSRAVSRYAGQRTYVEYKRPNFYRRHRKAINIAAGAGIGALVGGLVGGKKGVLIGGLGGAGGGALFTHVQKPKNYTRRVYRNY